MKKIIASKFGLFFLLLILFGINFLASLLHSRFDLTKEKRYTLSRVTKNLLESLDAPVTVDVFLKGDFPAGFRKLANSTAEFLLECEQYSRGNLMFHLIDPFRKANDSADAFVKATK